MSQIIALGEILIDFFGEKGKGLKNSVNFIKCFGGAPANYVIAAAKLGAKASLLASISRDFFGEFLIEALKKEKVDTSLVQRTDKKTSLAWIALDEKGRPDFTFFWENTSNTDLRKEHIKEAWFKKAKIFHFCSLVLTAPVSRTALFKALELAKKNKLIISFNPNLRKDLMKKDTLFWAKKALKYTNLLIASENELYLITGEKNMEKAVKKLKIEKIIVTRGEKGSVLYEKNKKIVVSAFKVKAIDTVGAGDAFSAGISVGLSKGYQGEKLLKFANGVAALSIQNRSKAKMFGAISSLPTLKEVEKFLKSRE